MSNSEKFYILEVGSKQIRCKPGEKILVDRIPAVQQGDKIQVKRVFNTTNLVNDNVECEVVSPLVLGQKIRIYKTKNRKGYEKSSGFRRQLTMIVVGGK